MLRVLPAGPAGSTPTPATAGPIPYQHRPSNDPLFLGRYSWTTPTTPARQFLQMGVLKSLTYQFDEAGLRKAGVDLDRRVSVDVKQASPIELLEAVLHPVGADLRVDGTTVHVFPRGTAPPLAAAASGGKTPDPAVPFRMTYTYQPKTGTAKPQTIDDADRALAALTIKAEQIERGDVKSISVQFEVRGTSRTFEDIAQAIDWLRTFLSDGVADGDGPATPPPNQRPGAKGGGISGGGFGGRGFGGGGGGGGTTPGKP